MGNQKKHKLSTIWKTGVLKKRFVATLNLDRKGFFKEQQQEAEKAKEEHNNQKVNAS